MSAAVVAYSRDLLTRSLKIELRGSGDVLPALRRISRDADIPYSKLYALKYRPGSDVDGSVLLKLHVFYEALCDRQAARYRVAREQTDTSHPLAALLTRLASSIAGEDHQQEG